MNSPPRGASAAQVADAIERGAKALVGHGPDAIEAAFRGCAAAAEELATVVIAIDRTGNTKFWHVIEKRNITARPSRKESAERPWRLELRVGPVVITGCDDLAAMFKRGAQGIVELDEDGPGRAYFFVGAPAVEIFEIPSRVFRADGGNMARHLAPPNAV